MAPKRVLLTGAAGMVARYSVDSLEQSVHEVTYLDIQDMSKLPVPADRTIVGSVTDEEFIEQTLANGRFDVIVHLGGIPTEATFQEVMDVNISGTHNILKSAVQHGVKKVVLASTNHAAGYHTRPEGQPPLEPDVEIRSDTYYGWSKASTEILARLFHDRFGLQVVVLRIAQSAEAPAPNDRGRAFWMSPADTARLLLASIESSGSGYETLWGVSQNSAHQELSTKNNIGYIPQDDTALFFDSHEAPAQLPNRYVGGHFCEISLGRQEWSTDHVDN